MAPLGDLTPHLRSIGPVLPMLVGSLLQRSSGPFRIRLQIHEQGLSLPGIGQGGSHQCVGLACCTGFNVVASETDPKLRMADIEAFTAAFPDSKYQDQVSNYAMYTLGPGQLNDAARLVAFGEKTLAANPKSLPALLLLASVYVEEPKPASVAKAISYSQRAIEAAKPDASDADKPRKLSAGVAHSTIGYAYMKQEKTAAAIPELKAAVALLKGQDDIPYSVALYRLGYAYAKLVRNTEAREVLMEAVKIQGPVQAVSQELLNKVNVARAKGK